MQFSKSHQPCWGAVLDGAATFESPSLLQVNPTKASISNPSKLTASLRCHAFGLMLPGLPGVNTFFLRISMGRVKL